jgi:hypothetical protein
LDGDELELISVMVDGQPADHRIETGQLVIEFGGDRATVETEVEGDKVRLTARGDVVADLFEQEQSGEPIGQ